MQKPAVDILRNLPSIDRLLKQRRLVEAAARLGHNPVRDAARSALEELRRSLRKGDSATLTMNTIEEVLIGRIIDLAESRLATTIVPVFNLTGTVLHTNLGRALLPDIAIEALHRAATNPVSLEYNLESGKRGDRDTHLEALLCELTGAEAATVVNNNAAAVLLVLATLAPGRDVIVSRGELVEIGGSFRIPEILRSAGCCLKEIGTTNRTGLSDYADAIDGRTALIMKVHTSNYEIRGFTEAVTESDLSVLSKGAGLPLVTDLGSGTLVDLSRFGLPREPTVSESILSGADLVTFSGDKLLGGPQAGIIVGRKRLVDRLRRHPLKRALRIDKLTLVALLEVLRLYRDPQRLPERLPTLRDLLRPLNEIESVALTVLAALKQAIGGQVKVALSPCKSQVGSGALPTDTIDSLAVCLEITGTGGDSELQSLALAFRSLPRPVIGRISDGRLLFDMRCLRDVDSFIGQLGHLSRD